MANPQVHYIDYPLGEYNDPPHLTKHLKKCHPEDTLNYKCIICGSTGEGRYPVKSLKDHYTQNHVSSAVDPAGPSTRYSLGECSSVGQSTATSSPQSRRTSTTPTRSPSYTAVTAGPSSVRNSSTSTTARSKTVAKNAAPNMTKTATRSGEAAAMRRPSMTVTVSKPRVVSVKIVRLPVKEVGVRNAAKPRRLRLQRKKVAGPSSTMTSNEGVVTRLKRSTSASIEKSAVTARLTALDRTSSRAIGNSKSQFAGNVRDVITRGRATESSIVPPRANREESSRQHQDRRRPDASVGQPSRDHPAPATVARQRRRERVATRPLMPTVTSSVTFVTEKSNL
ncbi:hypothetical protein ALC56_03034 [Trachymyrmex septentrionalis]|uniref:Uncharacterized protein n=1 Tax=Trachymyrmex septentrionalis TaxID=34720 RepID=A0A195FPV5_9HYME|nr:hypothetical protein ALC56_03034 [Trachymyrmex septentrionalis]